MNAEQIMTQVQVFASAWALVGGRFDNGDMLETANEEKAELKTAIEALVQERDALKKENLRLAGEVSNRNKRALEGDKAVKVLEDYCTAADKLAAENKALRDEHQQTIYANQCLVAALDRIHDVLNGVYVDDVAGIVNRALAANTPPV
jgi:regulator of replication initiation timing